MITRLLILIAILCWALWKLIAFVVPLTIKATIWTGTTTALLIIKVAQAMPDVLHFIFTLSPTLWNAITAFCVAVALAIALIRHNHNGSVMVGQQFLNAAKTEGVAVSIIKFQIR